MTKNSIRWADWPSDQPEIPEHCWPVPYGTGLPSVPHREPVRDLAVVWPYRWRENLVTMQSYWHRLMPMVCVRFGVPEGTWELSPLSLRWSVRRADSTGTACIGCEKDLTHERYAARMSWGHQQWCSNCVADRARAPVIMAARWPFGIENPASHWQGHHLPPRWEERTRLPWRTTTWSGLPEDPTDAEGILYWRRSL